MDKGYKNNLIAFKKHLETTLDEIMGCDEVPDHLDGIEITINQKTFKIELGADVFSLVEEMVDFEMNENGI